MSGEKLSEGEVTTRKRHGCVWCGQIIPKGDSAMRHAYVGEDGPQSDYYHLECWVAMNAYPDPEELCDGFMPGDFKRGSTDPT